MAQQETGTLEQFTTFNAGVYQTPDSDINPIDILALLLRRKRFIAGVAFLSTCITAATLYLLPPSYKAEATILPPQQQQSSLAALASGALGGLATSGMGAQLGIKNPADMYIGILKSRTIADDLIAQFNLKQVYRAKLASDARRALSNHASFASGKESIITISVKDHDPQRAAAMANAFIDELYKQNSRLALTDASQRRLFFEQQLAKEKDALANAEVGLKTTQQATGLLSPGGQGEVLIRSGAELRAQIASREVELQAMRSYATDENPKVQVLKREISALRGQLSQLEANGASGSKLEVSGARLPEASLEYIRRVRDLKYHETLYELLAKQYEAARIDEAKQAPVIQVIDRAVIPDKDSHPPRLLLILASMLGGAALGSVSVFASDRLSKLRIDLKRTREGTLPGAPVEQQA